MSPKKILTIIGAVVVIGGGIFLLKDKFGSSANDAQNLVNNTIANSLELNSVSFASGATVKIENLPDLNGELNVSLDGRINDIPKLIPDLDYTFSVSGDLVAEGQAFAGSAKLQMIFVEKKPYVKLIEVTLPPELTAQVGPLVSQFKNKWYSLPFDQAEPDSPTERAKQLKQLKELTREYDLITVTRDLGAENGIRRIAGRLSEAGISSYLQASANLTGESFTEADLTELKKFLQTNEASFDVWIDEDSQQFQRVAGKLVIQNPDGKEGQFLIDFETEIKDHNKTQMINAPENSEEFDPSILGL